MEHSDNVAVFTLQPALPPRPVGVRLPFKRVYIQPFSLPALQPFTNMFGTGILKGLVVTAKNFVGSYHDPERMVTVVVGGRE